MSKNRITAPIVDEPTIFTDESDHVNVGVETEEAFFGRVRAEAARLGKVAPQQAPLTLSFETPELLLEALTPKRYELLKFLRSHGAVESIEELAREIHRDRSTVTKDVQALQALGVVEIESVTHQGHGKRSRVSVSADNIQVQFCL